MNLSVLNDFIDQFGYFAMFLINWLLLFGLPLPNEIAASFSGYITATRNLNASIAFFSAYMGLVSATLFAFFIGKRFGSKLIIRFKKTRLIHAINRFEAFFQKYGKKSIGFSFFVPGVRWAMPYVVGAGEMTYGTFLKYSLIPSAGWLMLYFQIGRLFPNAYGTIVHHLRISILILLLLFAGILVIRYTVSKKFRREETK
ncbi:DedA family protein [Paenisporosarcina cavernae]|uniref:DedA family protein n=1 Tax=Paenisporosarcina cavernae TaxID=2320858 RepID=A0A385YVD6_9BACL|nr:DedA family protein [Paenisporosarcina cavernae]AYC29463.1 DedA family protein [Paenisporosarcina cavernae]